MRKLLFVVVIFLLIIASATAQQQLASNTSEAPLPNAPVPALKAVTPNVEMLFVEPTRAERPATHKFWDRTTFALSALTISGALADGITTQHVLAQHRTTTTSVNGASFTTSTTYVEKNPLAAPLVNRGWPGQIAATAIGAGADLGVRAWLHHKGHHRVERIIPFAFATTNALFAAHNAKYY